MFNIYFDKTFDNFYNKWVMIQISSFKESDELFNQLNEKSTVKDFITFFEKIKGNPLLKKEFEKTYNKECVKSFVLYLYENVSIIKENRKEQNQKYYDLVWLNSFFDKLLDEYYLDIEEYKKEHLKKEEKDLEYYKNILESGVYPFDFKREDFEKLKEETLVIMQKLLRLKKVDFVINGKYSNEELLKIMLSKKDYYSHLPDDDYDFTLYKNDFYNIFNYPLKDYLLFMMYLKEMSFKYGKIHLKEYYDSDGSEKIREKYKNQLDILENILKDITQQYEKDNSEFVFHGVNLNEEAVYPEEKWYSDDYFYKERYITLYSIWGVGCYYANRTTSPYFDMFYNENNRVEEILRQKEEEEYKKDVRKRPKFYIDFFTRNKMLMDASSFGSVLSDEVNWDKKYAKYRKEAEETVQKILNEK